MIFTHRANHPAHFGSTQPSQLSREAKVNDLDPEIVLGTTDKHDVVGLDVHVDDLEAVHEAEGLEDLAGDHLALVLVQLEGRPGDGVEEIAAPQVLGEDAGLVDPGKIFDKIHDKLTLGQFPQKSHLRGRGVLLI